MFLLHRNNKKKKPNIHDSSLGQFEFGHKITTDEDHLYRYYQNSNKNNGNKYNENSKQGVGVVAFLNGYVRGITTTYVKISYQIQKEVERTTNRG